SFFFQAEDGIRGRNVTGVQTCALPILSHDLPHLKNGTCVGSRCLSSPEISASSVLATVAGGSGPIGVAVNPTTNRVYVAFDLSNTISVVEGSSNTLVGSIQLSSSPSATTVNSKTN